MGSNILKYLLLPFTLLYGLVVIIRNKLYDESILKSYSFDIPVIGAGNLSTGGTGKTPMTEYIVDLLLQKDYKPAVLSRGYGRKTKGFLLADETVSASEIGDEPYQIFKKFPAATLAVCEDRVLGIKKLLEINPEINVVVLDDCYQHRRLKPGFLILLTDFNKPYFKDWLLPSGRLREPVSGRKRADIIIVTKSPLPLNSSTKIALTRKLDPFSHQQLYFTGIKYNNFISVNNGKEISPEDLKPLHILLFCGIANPDPLIGFLRLQYCHLQIVKFPDHHNFSSSDVEKIMKEWRDISSADKIMITTEKDWRRLENTTAAETLKNLPLYYLPIGLAWDADERTSFDAGILEYISRK